MSPPIQLFLTTIASAPALRQKQEYILRILQVKKIEFTSYDLASDEAAKKLWRRKAPPKEQTLPGILVGGRWPGNFSQFEEAVEYDELDIFLRLKEDWDPELDGDPTKTLTVQPIGVPGASSPLQMTKQRPSFAPGGPSPLRKPVAGSKDEEFDAGDEISGYGFQGLKVTMNELEALARELGLDDKDAKELAEGLGEEVDEKPSKTAPQLKADIDAASGSSSKKPHDDPA